MCSLFGLIDFKECLSTHTKNKILNTFFEEFVAKNLQKD